MDRRSTILQALGGEENIVDISHCATRLRFQLHDSSIVDHDALMSLPDVLGALPQADNGYQVIIGEKVHEIFREMTQALSPNPAESQHNNIYAAHIRTSEKETGNNSSRDDDNQHDKDSLHDNKNQSRAENISIQPKEKETPRSRKHRLHHFLLRFFGDSLGPLIGPLLGASLIITLISLLSLVGGTEQWGTVPDRWEVADTLRQNPSWTFINLMWTSVFTFLPLMVAYNASRKTGADPWVGFTIMGFVMLPGFTDLGEHPQAYTIHLFSMPVKLIRIFGLPLPLLDYSGQVIVPLLIALILGPFYRLLNRVIPATIALTFVPFIALSVMLPFTAFLIGPAGAYTSAALAHALTEINAAAPVVFAVVIPLLFPVVVPLGLHWPINALILLSISEKGYDYIQGPMGAWNFACFGATAGVLLLSVREKNVPMRQQAAKALTVGLIGGISEPSIYGIHSRFRRSYISILAGCVSGGLIIGCGGGVTTTTFAFTSVLTIPVFQPLGLYTLAVAVAFTVSLVCVVVYDYRPDNEKTIFDKTEPVSCQKRSVS